MSSPISATAGGVIAAGRFVKWNASGQVVQCTVEGEAVAGVCATAAASGDTVTIYPPGTLAPLVDVGGVITPGTDAFVMTSNAGKALAAAAGAGIFVGAAPVYNTSRAALADGDVCPMRVVCFDYDA